MKGWFTGTSGPVIVENSGKWDTSSVKNFEMCFQLPNLLMLDPSIHGMENWDVSSGESFERMFRGCYLYRGQGLENWDMSNAESVRWMFQQAELFNGLIEHWDLSNVTHAEKMMSETAFRPVDLYWDLRNCELAPELFYHCEYFNPIGKKGVDNHPDYELSIKFGDKLVDASGMFHGCTNWEGNVIGHWDMKNCERLDSMFQDCGSIDPKLEMNIGLWDTRSVGLNSTGQNGRPGGEALRRFAAGSTLYEDLSEWCMAEVDALPTGDKEMFKDNDAMLAAPEYHPVPGTCPRGEINNP